MANLFGTLNRFISRLDSEPQAQQHSRSTTGYGFQILRNNNSGLALEPWFDFIIGLNGHNIDSPDQTLFTTEIQNCAGSTISLGVYGAKGQQIREVYVAIPNLKGAWIRSSSLMACLQEDLRSTSRRPQAVGSWSYTCHCSTTAVESQTPMPAIPTGVDIKAEIFRGPVDVSSELVADPSLTTFSSSSSVLEPPPHARSWISKRRNLVQPHRLHVCDDANLQLRCASPAPAWVAYAGGILTSSVIALQQRMSGKYTPPQLLVH
ncbi:hypothetical protein LTR74_008690 [Friedmanniomyces endolithicus]|nr:hypothetical protein LTR74_008690 [Friedmanniomyces endolithicus]